MILIVGHGSGKRRLPAPLPSKSHSLSTSELCTHQLSSLAVIKVQSFHFQRFCSLAPLCIFSETLPGSEMLGKRWVCGARGEVKISESCFQVRTKSS